MKLFFIECKYFNSLSMVARVCYFGPSLYLVGVGLSHSAVMWRLHLQSDIFWLKALKRSCLPCVV